MKRKELRQVVTADAVLFDGMKTVDDEIDGQKRCIKIAGYCKIEGERPAEGDELIFYDLFCKNLKTRRWEYLLFKQRVI